MSTTTAIQTVQVRKSMGSCLQRKRTTQDFPVEMPLLRLSFSSLLRSLFFSALDQQCVDAEAHACSFVWSSRHTSKEALRRLWYRMTGARE
mmetsp:Transcript_65742/g.174254  ORF Transcript_65742/g.174254 Transcript_65742/m.174254 type:complete len:91 (-) Transcript_65742:66-338(-)